MGSNLTRAQSHIVRVLTAAVVSLFTLSIAWSQGALEKRNGAEPPASKLSGPFVGGLSLAGQGLSVGVRSYDFPPAPFGSSLSQFGGSELDFELTGPSLAISQAWQVGNAAANPLFLEWNSSLSIANGSGSARSQISGVNSLFLYTGGSPVGSIDLDTSATAGGATAYGDVQIQDSSGSSAMILSSAFSPSGSGAAIAQFAISSTSLGGAFLALTTDGDAPNALAIGAIYDDQGVALVGIGGFDGTSVTSRVSERLLDTEHQLLVGTIIPLASDWTLTPKAGPMYRYIGRDVNRRSVVDVDEGPMTGSGIPLIGISYNDDLRAHYAGVVGGFGLSRPLSDKWVFSANVSAGLAAFNVKHVSVAGIEIGNANPTAPRSQRGTANGWTHFGRTSLSLVRSSGSNSFFTVGLFADYLANAPTFMVTPSNGGSLTLSPDGTGANLISSGTQNYSTSLTTGALWDFGIGVSFSVLF